MLSKRFPYAVYNKLKENPSMRLSIAFLRSQGSGIKRYEQMTDDSRIQIYQSPDGETQVDVRFEHETVWLTQAQMGQVFDTTPEMC